MNKIKKILAPTDLSDLSAVGVRYALEMAREINAEVIVHHVIPVGEDWVPPRVESGAVRDFMTKETVALDKFLREKFSDCSNLAQVRQKVEFGGAYGNIVELAERESVDLIVMSTHGRTGLSHMLLGSVTENVIARAPCPVVAIPVGKRGTPGVKAA